MPVAPVPRPEKVHPLTLEALAASLPAVSVPAEHAGVTVTGVAQASDSVRPGDLYVGIPGAHAHGASYADAAAGAGAVAMLTDAAGAELAKASGLPVVLCEDPRALAGLAAAEVYGRPGDALTVIGVTGTNGKTTTCYLLEAGLRAAGHVTALIGTVETRLGDERLPSARTTPEAADLHALLAVARERGISAVAMEVSSHALVLHRVAGLRFAAGVFTNLSVDHLDFHRDLDDYLAAKARLFDGRSAREIVNVDDDAGRGLVTDRTVTVSLEDEATWRVGSIVEKGFSQRFRLLGPHGVDVEAGVGLPGRFNVTNAAQAIATLVAVGVPVADAVRGVRDAAGVPGRMERVRGGDPGVTAVVDYAHAPDGVVQALAALRPVTSGRLICVLGCGGSRDAGKRPLMGEAAARGADVFVATDDNPRAEDPAAVRAQMLAGVENVAQTERAEVREIGDRRAAIEAAVAMAKPGDTVAVLGKGHEQGQEIAGVVHPFDDRTVLAQALNSVHGGLNE